ncbi:MAG: two-component system, OmpR family, sensor kinase [Azoarcus sp.]|uniref:histidine kinase n=1 Tax=Aromatoleum tolulyticum TaxID=34027 RepID=A0A1N7AK62_9RHOO|nr:ATP-binding protein [Aromatoleum tolulyticum]MCK9985890.1 two-component system, OmpR family, sensor kinase [Azoarcus sp.]SIR39530.1 two-component system, OmpR family, sensor kinase [Aromatoleum tolulyticum]
MNSLRRTLLFSLLGALVLVFAIGGIATYRMAHNEIDALMDYNLRQFALSLRDRRLSGPNVGPLAPPEESLDLVIQIWDDTGVRLYLSHPHTALPARAQLGYTTVTTSEGDWRVYSIPLLDHVIQIAQPMAVRSRLAAHAALRTLIPLVALMPLLGALIWYLVGRGLRPLERLAQEVGTRRADSLDALPLKGIPDEAQPLVRALNELLEQLRQAISVQRAFVADAAHELRTPLAALQIQLQLCERARDETARAAALGELRTGLARAAHLVQQLLTLARQEPGEGAAEQHERVVLADIARKSLADYTAQAHERGIDLGADLLDDALATRGDPAALRTLAGNLIDNAIRYTPRGGRVDVSVGKGEGRCWLRVDDSGPGIPPEERDRVLNRFYRPAGQQESGSGLGLAIVDSIARRHDARIVLNASPLGGLRIAVGFPPA